jgi:hypothetical protein
MLSDCIESIRLSAPQAKIIAVDGAYENWVKAARRLAAKELEDGHDALADAILRFSSPKSPDRTLEILNDLKVDRVVTTDTPWAHEYEKRSQYLVGQDGDWYLVVDADERLKGKVDPSKLEDPAYNIMLYRDQDQHPYPITRMFRHQEGIAYRGAHHAIHSSGILWRKEICRTVGGKTYSDCCGMRENERLQGEPWWLFHLYDERSRDVVRNWVRGEYYRVLTGKEEKEFRETVGL